MDSNVLRSNSLHLLAEFQLSCTRVCEVYFHGESVRCLRFIEVSQFSAKNFL